MNEWIWFAGLLITIIIRTPYAKAAKNHKTIASYRSVIDKLSLAFMLIAMMFLPLLTITTSWFDFAAYQLPFLASCAGSILYAGYIWLFWLSHKDLDKNWSPELEIRSGHSLITHGIYGVIRHPMYASVWLAAIARAFLIQNIIGGCLAIPAFAFMYLTQIPKEENMMAERFGDAWRQHEQQTSRLLPFRKIRCLQPDT